MPGSDTPGGLHAPGLPVGRPQSMAEGTAPEAPVHAPRRPPVHARRDARRTPWPRPCRCRRPASRTLYTRLGENLEHVAEADEVAAHYIDADRPDRRGRDHRRGLGQADPARPRPRPRALPRPPRADRRACGGGRLVPLDRHGGQRLRRRDDRAVRAAARGPAAGRGSASRRTCAGPPPTSNGCARSIPPSGWSRAPTTRRSRSPTATGAASTRTSSASPSGSCSTAVADRSGSAWAPTTSRSSSRSPSRSSAAGIGRDGFEVEMLYGDPDRPAVPPGEGGLSRPDPHRVR